MLYSDYFVTSRHVSLGWLNSTYEYDVERRSLKTLEKERVATFYESWDAQDHADFRNRQAERSGKSYALLNWKTDYDGFRFISNY